MTARLQSILIVGIFVSWYWFVAHANGAPSSCSLHCFEYGAPQATETAALQPFNIVGHIGVGALQRVT